MILLFLISCASETSFQGTFVGNPGKGNSQIAASENITYSRAQTQIQYVYYFQGNQEYVSAAEQEIDLLTGNGDFSLYSGDWDFIVLEMAPGLSLEGTAIDNQPFSWNLEELFIKLSFQESIVQDNQYLLELGAPNWLNGEDIAALSENNTPISIEEYEEFSAELIEILEQESALFSDSNGDGIINDEERATNIAFGEDIEEEEEYDIWDLIDPFWLE